MRILFTRFPLESALGGAENQTLWLMEGLMERGHAVSFAGSCPVLLAECKKRRIPVTELNIGIPPVTKWGVVSFAWRKIRMRQRLKEMLEKNRRTEEQKIRDSKLPFSDLDVLVMLSLSEKLVLTDIAADAGTKVVWIEHDPVGRWLTKNPWLLLLLKQSQKAVTVTVSELSRKIYLNLGWSPKRTVAIPNGVPSPASTQSRTQKTSDFLLGCIARLSHEKGIDVLLRAMPSASTDIHLEIIGTGPEKNALQALVQTLHLNDRVTFTERVADISKAYSRFDALVLPSRLPDPFGLVAAESMLAGVPVIVTDACGIADYLEDGKDALIVKADSVSALTDAMKELGNRSKELGKNGQKTAQKKFTVERMVEDYEKLFTQKTADNISAACSIKNF